MNSPAGHPHSRSTPPSPACWVSPPGHTSVPGCSPAYILTQSLYPPSCSLGIPSKTQVSSSGCSATLGPSPEHVHQLCPLVFPPLRVLISLSLLFPSPPRPLSPGPRAPSPPGMAAILSPVPQVLPRRPELCRGGSRGPHGRKGGWSPRSPTPAGWWGRARAEKYQSISWTPGSGMSQEQEEEVVEDP